MNSRSAPQPHKTISCQQLLQDDVTHSGWIRNRSKLHKSFKFMAKVIPWLNKYGVLSKGCMYIYDSDTSKKPSAAFSLYGYNSVKRAGEIHQQDAPWAFKIISVDEDPSRMRYYSSSSEKELKVWMSEFKKQMMFANGKGARLSKKSHTINDENASFDDIEDSVYDSASSDHLRNIHKNDDLSESEGDDYNEIDDWDGESVRPLPPVPTSKEMPAGCYIDPVPARPERRKNINTEPPPLAANHEDSSTPNHRKAPPPLPHTDDGQTKLSFSTLHVNSSAAQSPQQLNSSPTERSSNFRPAPAPKPMGISMPRNPDAMTGTVNALKQKFNQQLKSPIEPLVIKKEVGGGDQDNSSPHHSTQKAKLQPSSSIPQERPPAPMPSSTRTKPDGTTYNEEDILRDILWNGKDKEEASRILNNIGEEGVFLVRYQNDGNDQVLVVYAEGYPRKYKINRQEGNIYISSEKLFSNMQEMLDYYHRETLPKRATCLFQPYSKYT